MYKIIQPHRSQVGFLRINDPVLIQRRQSDWTPPVTPALWGRLQGGGGYHSHHREGQWGTDCESLPGGQQPQRQEVIEKVTYQESSYQSPAAQPPQEHKWYEDHKKELEVIVTLEFSRLISNPMLNRSAQALRGLLRSVVAFMPTSSMRRKERR